MKRALILLLIALQVKAEVLLPPANKIVLQYAMDHAGKKVGRGLCYELVEGALGTLNKNWATEYPTFKKSLFSDKLTGYGNVLSSGDEVMPGDIIYFYHGNKSHIGIIKEVAGEGQYIIFDQNSAERIDKKSCVGTRAYDKKETHWKIIIFRPI